VGDWLYLDGEIWTLAIASDPASSEVRGMVCSINSPDTFVMIIDGYADVSVGLTGLVPGAVYFLSDTLPGQMGQAIGDPVIKALFVADTDVSGYIKIDPGFELAGSGSPYQAPSFSGFSIESQSTSLEVGATSNVDPIFTWSISNLANVQPNTIKIEDTTASVVLATGLSTTPPYSSTYTGITKTFVSSENFRITGTNTQGNSFSANFTISWYDRIYYGESATVPLTAADIKGLRASTLQFGFARTYNFIASPYEYKYLGIPISMGTPSSYRDQSTQLSVPFNAPYEVDVTNIYGVVVSYGVYQTYNKLGGPLNVEVA
jgi:hypothetical protein